MVNVSDQVNDLTRSICNFSSLWKKGISLPSSLTRLTIISSASRSKLDMDEPRGIKVCETLPITFSERKSNLISIILWRISTLRFGVEWWILFSDCINDINNRVKIIFFTIQSSVYYGNYSIRPIKTIYHFLINK